MSLTESMAELSKAELGLIEKDCKDCMISRIEIEIYTLFTRIKKTSFSSTNQ